MHSTLFISQTFQNHKTNPRWYVLHLLHGTNTIYCQISLMFQISKFIPSLFHEGFFAETFPSPWRLHHVEQGMSTRPETSSSVCVKVPDICRFCWCLLFFLFLFFCSDCWFLFLCLDAEVFFIHFYVLLIQQISHESHQTNNIAAASLIMREFCQTSNSRARDLGNKYA